MRVNGPRCPRWPGWGRGRSDYTVKGAWLACAGQVSAAFHRVKSGKDRKVACILLLVSSLNSCPPSTLNLRSGAQEQKAAAMQEDASMHLQWAVRERMLSARARGRPKGQAP